MGTKGARVTTDVTLPGRFLVLMPFSEFIGISRKLPDDERERLHARRVRQRRAGHRADRAHRRRGREREGPALRPRVPLAPVEARPAPGDRGAAAGGHLHRDGPRAALRARRVRRGLQAARHRRQGDVRQGRVVPQEDVTRAGAARPALPRARPAVRLLRPERRRSTPCSSASCGCRPAATSPSTRPRRSPPST